MANKGFALLLVVFMCFAISASALSLWRQASLNLDLVLEREKYYQNLYLSELVLNYGIALVKKNFDIFKEAVKERALCFNVDELVNRFDVASKASLVIKKKRKGLFIVARLEKGESGSEVSCVLDEQHTFDFSIGSFI